MHRGPALGGDPCSEHEEAVAEIEDSFEKPSSQVADNLGAPPAAKQLCWPQKRSIKAKTKKDSPNRIINQTYVKRM